MRSDKVIKVTDSEFESTVINSDLSCLVFFWATWCGPCRVIGRVIDQLANEFDGRVRIVKMDMDENSETFGKFGIRSTPTLILFKNGQVLGQIIGVVDKGQLVALLNKAL